MRRRRRRRWWSGYSAPHWAHRFERREAMHTEGWFLKNDMKHWDAGRYSFIMWSDDKRLTHGWTFTLLLNRTVEYHFLRSLSGAQLIYVRRFLEWQSLSCSRCCRNFFSIVAAAAVVLLLLLFHINKLSIYLVLMSRVGFNVRLFSCCSCCWRIIHVIPIVIVVVGHFTFVDYACGDVHWKWFNVQRASAVQRVMLDVCARECVCAGISMTKEPMGNFFCKWGIQSHLFDRWMIKSWKEILNKICLCFLLLLLLSLLLFKGRWMNFSFLLIYSATLLTYWHAYGLNIAWDDIYIWCSLISSRLIMVMASYIINFAYRIVFFYGRK